MDIAAMSTILAQGNVQAQASVQIASKVMDMAKQNASQLIEMMNATTAMERSVNPNVGGNIDIKL